MRFKAYSNLDDLPPCYAALFEAVEQESFFNSRLWFRVLRDTALPPDQELRLFGVEEEGGGAALGLLITSAPRARGNPFQVYRLTGFHNVYTLRFAPLISPVADKGAVVRLLVQAVCAQRPRWDAISLRMLERQSNDLDLLTGAFRENGMTVEPFFQFGNWFEDIGQRSFADFVATRSKRVKKTLAWKARRFGRKATAGFELVSNGEALQRAIDDYHSVYAISWKEPESNPALMERLIEECVGQGLLRMGILHYEGAPVAAWLFIVFRGTALAFKTAYDERAPKNLSIGAVLTYRVLEQLLDQEEVERIDFGIGDEPYKSEWLTSRQERWGLNAYNNRTIRGAVLATQAKARSLARKLLRSGRGPDVTKS